jgi:phage terminase large subunit-like protein
MVRIERGFHRAQREIHASTARFRVVDAGRRFGKTRLGVWECLEVALNGGRAWWIAPSFPIAQVGWRPLRRIGRTIPGASVKLAEMTVELSTGGEVRVRSADNPDSLRGEGLDFAVMDEAAFMKPEAWTEALRPALSDRLGRALFISTPRGRNWFWEMYQRGVRGEGDYQAFQFPTSANPKIAAAEIEAARLELPELIFRQEYLAEFIDDQGSVFRRVQEAARLQPLTAPKPDRQYIAGVDVAASIDYTVVSVLDTESKHMVYMDRFNRVDYNVLADRLSALSHRWKLDAMKVEANSIGQPVIDAIRAKGVPVIPFTTTGATKQTVIQNLQSAFEHGEIAVINDPILIGELLSFESKRNPSGSFSYSAPEGMHDDCVMSLAIAWDGVANIPWTVY